MLAKSAAGDHGCRWTEKLTVVNHPLLTLRAVCRAEPLVLFVDPLRSSFSGQAAGSVARATNWDDNGREDGKD